MTDLAPGRSRCCQGCRQDFRVWRQQQKALDFDQNEPAIFKEQADRHCLSHYNTSGSIIEHWFRYPVSLCLKLHIFDIQASSASVRLLQRRPASQHPDKRLLQSTANLGVRFGDFAEFWSLSVLTMGIAKRWVGTSPEISTQQSHPGQPTLILLGPRTRGLTWSCPSAAGCTRQRSAADRRGQLQACGTGSDASQLHRYGSIAGQLQLRSYVEQATLATSPSSIRFGPLRKPLLDLQPCADVYECAAITSFKTPASLDPLYADEHADETSGTL